MAGENKRYYRGRAKSWGLGEFETGTKYVGVSFEVLDEDAPDDEVPWKGWLTDKTLERTVESLRTMGWKGEDLTEIADGAGGLDANEVSLVVQDEEYNGKWYPRVQWVNASRGATIQGQLKGDAVKSFAAQMREKIRAIGAASGAKPGAPQAQRQPQKPKVAPPTDPAFEEDIPF
jgi:hypothetical protein